MVFQRVIDVQSDGAESVSSNFDRSNGSGGTDTDSRRTGTNTEDDEQNIKDSLAKLESRNIFKLRMLVVLILVCACMAICFTIYYTTLSAEIDEFDLQFEGSATKVIDALEQVVVKMSAVSGVGIAATAGSQQAANESWPFYTLNRFQERATNARLLSGAIYVSINPIVTSDQLLAWEEYVQSDANEWISEGFQIQEISGVNGFVSQELVDRSFLTSPPMDPLHAFDAAGNPRPAMSNGPIFLPRWQTSPVLQRSFVNENILEDETVSQIAEDSITSKSAILGGFDFGPAGTTAHPHPKTSLYADLLSIWEGSETAYAGDPMSNFFVPIFDSLDGDDTKVVAVLRSTIHWLWFLKNILPTTAQRITVVVENACDGNYTYELIGNEAFPIGFGDLHNNAFSEQVLSGRFPQEVLTDGTFDGVPFSQGGCPYSFHVFPTKEAKEYYATETPLLLTFSVAAIFLFTLILFFCYDGLVERRQRLVLAKATQSTAIVSSLFPRQVRDRLLAIEADKRKGNAMMAPRHHVKTFLNAGHSDHDEDRPIADLFPHCTVMFCDMAGFTAWSSTREPAQVFLLLQTVYQNFDLIAKRRRVFKVETIGDSYLAVTGLPEPQSQHATIMSKFAWDCYIRLAEVLKELEVSLGPDTGDLSMRFGMHSGSVTAGVLKGDRARFQLFGDTVNTAARMESTGIKGRIQVSEVTAQILMNAGKGTWLTPRGDWVEAKGKGTMKTYWLDLGSKKTESSSAEFSTALSQSVRSEAAEASHLMDLKERRLVDWVSEILLDHIKKVIIVQRRCGCGSQASAEEDIQYSAPDDKICLDEVMDAVQMPQFDPKVADAMLDYKTVGVPRDIVISLREYVAMIARAYRNNPFHNFEHACHVTMSVNKLLTRVVTPDLTSGQQESAMLRREDVAAEIHNFTHGLTSDPLAVFAIVFSALIHDVDHQGVSNTQLEKEEPEMAEHYRNKSVAEQNSLDVAWDMLMTSRFADLRRYIFGSKTELLRFRQLIVNVVLATDIFDKELGQQRTNRWERAFHGGESLPSTVVNDLRATIVIEHIIQASDVSHTMQHWHVYQKWNRKLFMEMHQAFKAGRMGADPAAFWYKGEIGFFDNYVIPLAKKLKECNVFGVSSDEYLGYAQRNRAEWEERGEEIVKELIKDTEGVATLPRVESTGILASPERNPGSDFTADSSDASEGES